jgi:thioesterase domain-containing protein
VPIQTSGAGTPFFCVHGAEGNVLIFRELAHRIGETRPFYGLQAQGVDGHLRPLDRIEDMAALYISAIRNVQPRGPYLLGGYSGGGVIAVEMAQQLRAAGEKTALIALLDTFSPTVPERCYTWRDRLQELARSGPEYLVGRVRRWRSEWTYRSQLFQIERYTSQGLTIPLEWRKTHLLSTYLAAQRRYQPQNYSGQLTLFRAKKILAAHAHAGPFLGWDGLADEGIDVHEIDGGHADILSQPYVEMLAGELNEVLARVDRPLESSDMYAEHGHVQHSVEMATVGVA